MLYPIPKSCTPRMYVLWDFMWSVVCTFLNAFYPEGKVLWWREKTARKREWNMWLGNRRHLELMWWRGPFSTVSCLSRAKLFAIAQTSWDSGSSSQTCRMVCIAFESLHSWFDHMLRVTSYDGNGGRGRRKRTYSQSAKTELTALTHSLPPPPQSFLRAMQ